jgi:hypothetical protein
MKRHEPIHRLLRIAVMAVASAVVMTLIGASPALANATLCSGNDWTTCTRSVYTDHGYAANSGTSFWGAVAGHN